MTTRRSTTSLTRRSALVGLGTAGVGLALATRSSLARAQDATPAAMAHHPIVGTWVIDRETDNTAETPSIVIFMADGGFLDASQGTSGIWQATGPRSAACNGILVLEPEAGDAGGYLLLRSACEVEEGANEFDIPLSFTFVAADGTVIASGPGMSHARRMQVEPMEAAGTPVADFPTWEPMVATPES